VVAVSFPGLKPSDVLPAYAGVETPASLRFELQWWG
jgi:hypothetical protein